MRVRIILLCGVLLFPALSYAVAQKTNVVSRYINSLINDTSLVSQPQFLNYPTLAYSPETSLEVGLGSLYVFMLKKTLLTA